MSDDLTGPRPGPTPASQRVATLDVLRGAAILGILLVNIELFRGSELYHRLAGQPSPTPPGDAVAEFAIGWLVSGKFLSSFALLFGVGAAMTIERSRQTGHPPRPLLARRYAWLALFGLVHMLVLFSGDILFMYALAGMLLLAFATVDPQTLRWWAGAILVGYLVIALAIAALSVVGPAPADDPETEALQAFVADAGETVRAAFTDGTLVEQVAARAREAALVQSFQLIVVPWILALFLVGMAIGRSGLIWQLPTRTGLLARVAGIAVPAGLVVNLPLGWSGPLGGSGTVEGGVEALALPAQLIGAPVLAVGYLSALAWVCQQPGWLARLEPLRRTGRMALSAYLLQSVVCTGVFVGLGYYDRLSLVESLAVVAAVWVVVVTACFAWLHTASMGPLERLWRRLTYGRAR